nr:MAG TPA: hypothetical protein [Microviridae sp.]
MKFKINHTNATAEGIVFTEPSIAQCEDFFIWSLYEVQN